MGESPSIWTLSCNGSVRVELTGHRTTSDDGALLRREALDSSGVIEALLSGVEPDLEFGLNDGLAWANDLAAYVRELWRVGKPGVGLCNLGDHS